MFLPSPNKILGLDLSDLSFKAVQIDKRNGRTFVRARAQIDIAGNIIEDGRVIKADKAAGLIKKMLGTANGKFTTGYAAVSLPEIKTFIKMVEINASQSANLGVKNAIKKELSRHVPINIEELEIDWLEIPDNDKKNKFLVGAVEKKIRDSYLDVCERVKIKVTAFEIEAQSIVRALFNYDDFKFEQKVKQKFSALNRIKHGRATQIIIDLGATRTSLILFDDNMIQFTDNVTEISGQKLTAAIANRKKISLADAEKLKKICGADAKKCKGAVRETVENMINALTNEIIKMAKFYQLRFAKDTSNAEIILCGGGANLKSIDTALAARLKRKVAIGDPLTNIRVRPELSFDALSYTTAIGLALRNFFEKNDQP